MPGSRTRAHGAVLLLEQTPDRLRESGDSTARSQARLGKRAVYATARTYTWQNGGAVQLFGLLMVMAIPALGLLLLVLFLDRWGRRHDPMKHSHMDHLSPRSSRYDPDERE